MKRYIIIFSFLLLPAATIMTGCTKKFVEINTNPASYSQSNFNPNYLLTDAQLTYTGSIDFSYETWRANLIYCSTMMQGLSTVIGYWAGDKYLLNEGYTGAYWEKAYPEQVKVVVDLVEFTKDIEKFNNVHQVGRIMKAMIMERITDLYGDIPYFNAGKGYYDNSFFPVYDKQQDIYTDLLKEVDEATTALNDSGDQLTGDVIYAGDLSKWRKFGNTLMLRMAMRLSKADAATAQSYVTKVAGKTMESIDDDAMVKHDLSGSRATVNRNSQVLVGDGGQEHYYVKWSKTFIDYLKSTSDPRLGKVAVTQLYLSDADKTQNGTGNPDPSVQKGMPNGKDLSGIPAQTIGNDPSFTTFPDYSSPSPYLIKKDGPTFILTYAESELLLADAAQRFGTGDAATHYTNGVRAAMTCLSQYDANVTISDATANTYLAAHPYDPANGDEMINTQYWALNNTLLNFYESWFNWRRTGFPVLTPVVYPNNATNGTIPRRFPYPTFEASSNPVNYKAAHDAVPGGDVLTSRVWWDKE